MKTIIKTKISISIYIICVHGFLNIKFNDVGWLFETHETASPSGIQIKLTEWKVVSNT